MNSCTNGSSGVVLEIYAQRVRDGRRVVVSTDGGERPLWTREGLVYQSRGRLMRATIAEDAQNLRVAQLAAIADLQGRSVAGFSPDGRLLLHQTADAHPTRAVINLEWVREVRALLGPAVTVPR